MQKNELFDFMIEQVTKVSKENGYKKPQAFAKWFANLYFPDHQNFFPSDGSRDGKIDAFFKTNDGKVVKYHVINSKFTEEINKTSPVTFYDEINKFYSLFENKDNRSYFLEKAVKDELKNHYKSLFSAYDEGNANLIFITNQKKNDAQYISVKKLPIKVFHQDDIIHFITDDLDNAMPRTPDLSLYNIHNVLSPDRSDTEVSTSIVFARLIDFIKYMEKDPNDLLFARNIRLNLGNTPVNRGIKETFATSPKEFAFSNNGITILCEHHTHDPGKKELLIYNPRVVNGSQTLHSVRDVPNPSSNARVMLRIIEIPPITKADLPSQRFQKKQIINKIALRSNQQNPIKLWNLVANDDFQLELYRYFRDKNLFYERRTREYRQRSRQLRSINLKKGPSIKLLSQIISCYYWNKKLGPALARNLSKLFDQNNYAIIMSTKPELAYQLYLLNEIIDYYYDELVGTRKKYQQLRGYISQSLFSILCKVIESSNLELGESSLTSVLERHKNELYDSNFKKLIKNCADFIDENYIKVSKQYHKLNGAPLSIANYFKSNVYMMELLNKNLSFPTSKLVKSIFKK